MLGRSGLGWKWRGGATIWCLTLQSRLPMRTRQHQRSPTLFQLALRVLGRGEGVEQCLVGLSGVEQGADFVVVEVSSLEGGAFDAFDQVVSGFGGAVGDPGGVPGRYLVPPVADGAAQAVDFGGQAQVLELAGDFGDCGGAEFGVGNVIDASQGFFSGARRCVPRRGGRLLRAGPAAWCGRFR